MEKSRLDAVENRSVLGVEHDIKADSRPIKQRLYRVNHLVREHTDKKLVEVLKLCVVEPSSSTWSSPILFVK